MKQVIWAAPARQALADLVRYYSAIDPDLAERIVDIVVSTPERLLEYPRMGAPTADPVIRRWRVRSLPFLLIYRITARGITVLDVRHTARPAST